MEGIISSPKTSTTNPDTGSIDWRPIFAETLSFLAAVWQKIRSGFASARYYLSSDITKPLDIDRIAAHLAVVRRANEEGSQNLPPSGEEVPTGTQREIIDYFTNLRQRAQQRVAETAEKLRKTSEKIDIADSLTTLRDIPADCENKILRHVTDFESRLNKTVDREQKQRQHYDAFRKKNGLDRLAHYPGAAHFYYLIAAALIVAVAFALARIVEISAAGNADVSAAWIVMVSAAAVIVPLLFGDLWLRSINHVGRFRRSFGWIGAIVSITAITGIASYADLHIAAASANPDVSNRDVLDAMLAGPIDFVSTIVSWKAFGLVALTGVFAMLLGYRLDDSYPGYGTVQRVYYRERDARDETSSRLRKRINSRIDKAEAEVAAIARSFKNEVMTYIRSVEHAEQSPSVLNDYDAELEDACNTVLDRYRVANAAARRSDLPLSFAEHVCFNPNDETSHPLPVNSSRGVEELQAAILELENEANLARQKLRALNLRMISSIGESQGVDTDSTA